MQLETALLNNDAVTIPTDHDRVVRLHMLMDISKWQYLSIK